MSKSSMVVVSIAIGCASQTSPELESWLQDWEDARRCLLADGDEEAAQRIAKLRLSGRTRSCKAHLAILDRLGGPAARAVAAIDEGAPPAKLGAAIDAVDRLAGELRTNASLPPLARPRSEIAVLPVGTPIVVDKLALTADTPIAVQGGAIHGHRMRGAERIDFVARPAGVRTFQRADAAAIATFVEGADRIAIRGEPAGARFPYALELERGGARRRIEPVGSEGFRLELVSQDREAGVVDLLVRSPVGARGKSAPRPHRIFVHRHGPGTARSRAALAGTPVPQPPSLDAARFLDGVRVDCRDDGTLWMTDAGAIVRFDDRGDQILDLPSAVGPQRRDVDCRGARALVLARGPDRLDACSSSRGCETVLAPVHGLSGFAAIHRDTWIYAAQLEAVVAIWRGTTTPVFVHLTAPGRVVAIASFADVAHLVVVDADRTYRMIAVPAM